MKISNEVKYDHEYRWEYLKRMYDRVCAAGVPLVELGCNIKNEITGETYPLVHDRTEDYDE